MEIGVLGGTGPAGSALALRLASVGYDTIIGSRDAARAADVARSVLDRVGAGSGGSASGAPTMTLAGASNEDAAACDVVVVATPWDAAAVVAADHRGALSGKVVISMANALIRVGREFQPLVPPRGSVAAHVQAEVPEAMVAGAFHHIPAVELAAVGHTVESDVLICSDHQEAIELVSDIVRRIPGCRPLDSGELSNATAIEAFTAVLLQLNVRYRTRAALRITGIGDEPASPTSTE